MTEPIPESPEELAAERETATHDLSAPDQRRALVAAGIGNALEWYDWTIYAAFSVFFADQVFGGSMGSAAIWASLVFALGFIARPAGGIILGNIADKRSRSLALYLSIGGMCIGSLGIALVPTAASWGVWAGVWLLVARIIQGMSLGGELPAAVAYLVDFTKPGRRARFVSSFSFTLVIGTFVGSLVGVLLTAALDDEQMAAWGWRIPFLIGAAFGLLGFWLRRHTPHSPPARREGGENALVTLLQKYRGPVLRCMAVAAAECLGFYVTATIFPQIARSEGAAASTTFAANMVGLAVMGLVVLVYARLADRYGLERLLAIALVTLVVVTLPCLLLVNGQTVNTFVLQVLVLFPMGMVLACDLLYVADQFPRAYRALGLGVAYTVTVTLFGGTAELLWNVLLENGITYVLPLYVATVAAIGAVVVIRHAVSRTAASSLGPTAG